MLYEVITSNDEIRGAEGVALKGCAVDLQVPGIGGMRIRENVELAVGGHHRRTARLGKIDKDLTRPLERP